MPTVTAVMTPVPAADESPAAMTDLIEPGNGDSATPDPGLDPAALPHVEALWVRPDQLVIAQNVRKTFDLTDYTELRASVTEFGVQTPILVSRRDTDTFWVLEGQLRTLIARAVGTPLVPVWVSEPDSGIDENERRIATTLMQINANDRRVAMAEVDRADGVALMLDLGASVTRVAKGLQRTRSEVRKIAAVAPSPTARGLADAGAYGLDQLAFIGEYETLGDTDAVERLLGVPRSRFAYVANQISADREENRARLRAAVPYAGLGFGVLAEEPDTGGEQPEYFAPHMLETAGGEQVTESLATADAARWVVYLDLEEHEQHPHAPTAGGTTPGQGTPPSGTVEHPGRWVPTYFLPANQLDTSGLRVRPTTVHDNRARADALRLNVLQITAERDNARRERRIVRELNKRGAAAKTRREEFLTRLLTRRTPPAHTAQFVAAALAQDPHLLSTFHGPNTTLRLLGITGFTSELLASPGSARAGRAWVIVAAMVLGAFESRTGKDAWRGTDPGIQRYLRFLAEVGASMEFELVDIERAAAGLLDYRDIELDAA